MEKGFTLVIPLYNKVDVFRNTLDSVLNNHGEYPFKCIIVDDDSTDGSSEIGIEYDTKYPDVFQYIKKKHRGRKGPVEARNLGIKLAETEYIGFLDCDDLLCAGFIDRGCRFLDEHPEYSLYGNGNLIYNGEDYIKANYHNCDTINTFIEYYTSFNLNTEVHFCANIYKTELVKQNLFTENYCDDNVFLFKYIYKNEPVYIDNTINDTIIWNFSHNRNSYEWNTQLTSNQYPIDEIMESVKRETPNFKYGFNRCGSVLYIYSI